MLESDDIHLFRCDAHRGRPPGSASYSIAISNVGRDKSIADDFVPNGFDRNEV
jgi:hypothetical protein